MTVAVGSAVGAKRKNLEFGCSVGLGLGLGLGCIGAKRERLGLG